MLRFMTKSLNLLRKTFSIRINNPSEFLIGVNKFKDDVELILFEFGFLKTEEPDPVKNAHVILEHIFHRFHGLYKRKGAQ